MSYVYILAHPDGLRKIGHSNRPSCRLNEVQRECPERLRGEAWFKLSKRDMAHKLEKQSHLELKSKRFLGEWFKCSLEEAQLAIKGASKVVGVKIEKGEFPYHDWLDGTGNPTSIEDVRMIRAAKALLGISWNDVRDQSGVDGRVMDFLIYAKTENVPLAKPHTDKVIKALEAAGIEFIEENGGGPGVRLKRTG